MVNKKKQKAELVNVEDAGKSTPPSKVGGKMKLKTSKTKPAENLNAAPVTTDLITLVESNEDEDCKTKLVAKNDINEKYGKKEEIVASKQVAKKRLRSPDADGVVVQSSGRISKRPKKEYDPYSPPKRAASISYSRKPQTTPYAKKKKNLKQGRICDYWSANDKKHFFEGVKEHGRDWTGLYEYMKKHNKNKQAPERSREKVRNFWYRIWHKIFKYLTCPEGVTKQALEIFGIICYGEIRKRIGSYVDSYIGEKLNEMVQTGATVVNWKEGRKIKTYRLKTPHCAVLQRISNLEVQKIRKPKKNPLCLPTEIVVELRPKNNAAWTNVQALSQNPRVRTKLHPGKSLSSIIDFLNKKWKSHRLKIKENMNEKEKAMKELKLHPPPNVNFCSWELIRLHNVKANRTHPPELLGLKTYLENLKNFTQIPGPPAVTVSKKPGKIGKKQNTNFVENIDLNEKKNSQKSPNNSANSNKDTEVCFTNTKTDDSNKTSEIEKNTLNRSPSNIHNLEKGILDFKFARSLNKEVNICDASKSKEEIEYQNNVPQAAPSECSDGIAKIVDIPEASLKYDSDINANEKSSSSESKNNINNDPDNVSTTGTKSFDSHDVNSASKAIVEQDKVESMPLDKNSNLQSNAKKPEEELLITKPIITNVVNEKIEAVKQGLVRTKAEVVTVADLFLMMGSPSKIVLEYEWVDVVTVPDFLDISNVTNMLRRLIHLATTEFSDFSRSKQLPKEELGTCQRCSQTFFSTPPSKGRAKGKRTKNDPSTPRSSKRETAKVQTSSPGHRDDRLPPRFLQSPPPVGVNDVGKLEKPPSPPALVPAPAAASDVSIINKTPTAFPHDHSQASLQELFKIPATVAPRPTGDSQVTGDTSPITINNIAEKLSPSALMGYITEANNHKSQQYFIPPFRQKPVTRRPMIVQRKVPQKPFNFGSSNLQRIKQARLKGSAVKLKLDPTDGQGISVRSMVPGAQAVAAVYAAPGAPIDYNDEKVSLQPVVNISCTPDNSTVSDPSAESSSVTWSSASQALPTEQKTESSQNLISLAGETPQPAISSTSLDSLFKDLLQNSNSTCNLQDQSSKATPTMSNIICQAALATGINIIDAGCSNSFGDLALGKDGFPLIGEGSNSNLSSYLDVSMQGVPSGSTADKLLDLALGNSSASFNGSGLLDPYNQQKQEPASQSSTSTENQKGENMPNKMSFMLSPNLVNQSTKNFKDALGTVDEDQFNLSSFLPDTPEKKSAQSSLKQASESFVPAHDNSSNTRTQLPVRTSASILSRTATSLLGDSSRDSVRFDMDSALQSMLNESSLEYVSKFAALAEELASSSQEDNQSTQSAN